MAFNFPDSPNLNDEYTAGDRTWVWDGTVWLDKGSTLAIGELSNVTVLNPVEGQVVQYNGTQWVNAEIVTDPNPQIFMTMGA